MDKKTTAQIRQRSVTSDILHSASSATISNTTTTTTGTTTAGEDNNHKEKDGDGHKETKPSFIRTLMAKIVPLNPTYYETKEEIPEVVLSFRNTITKYCGLGTLTGSIVISLLVLVYSLWQMDAVRESWLAQYYLDMYDNDLAFRALAIYIPAVSFVTLLVTTVPLSLLVMADSNLINKYYLSKKRENVNGTFWFSFWMILFNHMFLVFVIGVFYPTIWRPVLTSVAVGWSKDMSITEEVTKNPWMALVFITQFVVNVYLEDFYYYLFHAALHKYKTLYRHIHIYHHKFYPVMAVHGANVHPVEYVLVSLPVLFACITTLSHFRIAMILTAWRQMVNADTHCGFHHPFMDKIYRYIPFMNGADSHDYHHYMVVGNYSTFSDGGMDTWLGTVAKGYPKFKEEVKSRRDKMAQADE